MPKAEVTNYSITWSAPARNDSGILSPSALAAAPYHIVERELLCAPQKRTLAESIGMSAKCQQRTHAPQQNESLFDHDSITSSARAGIVGGTVIPIAFARIYWWSLLNRDADRDAQSGAATSIVLPHRQDERILSLIAGGRREDDHMLILRSKTAVRWVRRHRHAVKNGDATGTARCVVPTDAARLAAGDGDRRRAAAAPRQVRRLGAAGWY
jgi:hypothetical protein